MAFPNKDTLQPTPDWDSLTPADREKQIAQWESVGYVNREQLANPNYRAYLQDSYEGALEQFEPQSMGFLVAYVDGKLHGTKPFRKGDYSIYGVDARYYNNKSYIDEIKRLGGNVYPYYRGEGIARASIGRKKHDIEGSQSLDGSIEEPIDMGGFNEVDLDEDPPHGGHGEGQIPYFDHQKPAPSTKPDDSDWTAHEGSHHLLD